MQAEAGGVGGPDKSVGERAGLAGVTPRADAVRSRTILPVHFAFPMRFFQMPPPVDPLAHRRTVRILFLHLLSYEWTAFHLEGYSLIMRNHISNSAFSPVSDEDGIPLGFGGVTASVGDHIAHFYKGPDQRFSVLGPYVSRGLQRGDRCACIVSPDTADGLRTWLRDAGVDVAAAQAAGQLILHPGEATEDDMHALAERIDAQAQEDGHAFVRWAGDGGWALRRDISVCEMLRWEALYDQCSTDWQMLALCQFDLTVFGGDVVMDAMRSHPLCVMGEVVVPNPMHTDPDVLREELSPCD